MLRRLMNGAPWYHDGRGPSLTCTLCRRLDTPQREGRCPACWLRWEAHALLPCQGTLSRETV